MKKNKISREDALKLIANSSIYGNLGLFVGAGLSMGILNDEWNEIALSWKQLIYKCAEEFGVNLKTDIRLDGLSYPEIATEIAKIIATNSGVDYDEAIKKLKSKIAELTSWYPEKEKRDIYGELLYSFDPKWIITTNYDLIIECLLTGKCLSLGPNDQLISPKNLIPVYHLHGVRTNPNSIIISQEDYISLFRPNQYRQHKLPLTIKESTTLIIGYGLGDVNVLTAVDWSNNVYSGQRIGYPHDIIQLLFVKKPKAEPYRDRNGILVIEFLSLEDVLNEISTFISNQRIKTEDHNQQLEEINAILNNPSEDNIKTFIDDDDFRKQIIETLAENDVYLISGFLELFSKAIEKTWVRAAPKGAFHAYNENLKILMDILENIALNKIPPALLEAIAYNLNRVGYFVGNHIGQSNAAYQTWKNRKSKLPSETILELRNIAKARNYTWLSSVLNK